MPLAFAVLCRVNAKMRCSSACVYFLLFFAVWCMPGWSDSSFHCCCQAAPRVRESGKMEMGPDVNSMSCCWHAYCNFFSVTSIEAICICTFPGRISCPTECCLACTSLLTRINEFFMVKTAFLKCRKIRVKLRRRLFKTLSWRTFGKADPIMNPVWLRYMIKVWCKSDSCIVICRLFVLDLQWLSKLFLTSK